MGLNHTLLSSITSEHRWYLEIDLSLNSIFDSRLDPTRPEEESSILEALVGPPGIGTSCMGDLVNISSNVFCQPSYEDSFDLNYSVRLFFKSFFNRTR